MQNKQLLLATFLDIQEQDNKKEIINNFIDKLVNNYNIQKEKIFIIKNLTNVKQYIITYIFKLNEDEKINFNEISPGTVHIHKNRNTNTIYSINALNKLIEQESGLIKGNINYKAVEIKWDKYRNSCIMLKEGNLIISHTKRIFL